MIDLRPRLLNRPTSTNLFFASSISESGSILIYSDELRSSSAEREYYYLATPVPEPAIFQFGLSGLFAFLVRRAKFSSCR